MATSTTYVYLLNSFEKAYTLSEAKKLLTPRWRAENEAHGAPPSTGFCYIAAEAAYHILQNERPKGYVCQLSGGREALQITGGSY